jgi:hypothetical protein
MRRASSPSSLVEQREPARSPGSTERIAVRSRLAASSRLPTTTRSSRPDRHGDRRVDTGSVTPHPFGVRTRRYRQHRHDGAGRLRLGAGARLGGGGVAIRRRRVLIAASLGACSTTSVRQPRPQRWLPGEGARARWAGRSHGGGAGGVIAADDGGSAQYGIAGARHRCAHGCHDLCGARQAAHDPAWRTPCTVFGPLRRPDARDLSSVPARLSTTGLPVKGLWVGFRPPDEGRAPRRRGPAALDTVRKLGMRAVEVSIPTGHTTRCTSCSARRPPSLRAHPERPDEPAKAQVPDAWPNLFRMLHPLGGDFVQTDRFRCRVAAEMARVFGVDKLWRIAPGRDAHDSPLPPLPPVFVNVSTA